MIAVSPIVGGLAIKGPAAKMMTELGVPPTPIAVAKHYGSLLSGFVLDQTDHEQAKDIPIPSIVTQTIMLTLQDRIALRSNASGFGGNDLSPLSKFISPSVKDNSVAQSKSAIGVIDVY